MRWPRIVRDNISSNIHNHNGQKRARTGGSRSSWILIGAGVSAASFWFLFVFPLLLEVGDSSTVVNGFVSIKPKTRTISTSVTSTTTMAVQKQEDHPPNDKESRPPQQLRNEQQSRQHPQRIFFTPINASDFTIFGYKSNPTVFGSILRGELRTKFLLEREELIAFEDIRPRAPFHALVISKEHIPSVLELDHNDSECQKSLSLLQKMSEAAHELVRDQEPEAYEQGDYRLCFHIPPFNSVDHLHLHVLAPASSMAPWYLHGKYNIGTSNDGKHRYNVRWCIGLTDVEDNLRNGSSPTPYRRDDSWATVLSDLASSIQSILRSSKSTG